MVSKEFFKAVQEKSLALSNTCLIDQAGVHVRDFQELHQICVDFYKELYSELATTPDQEAARQLILDQVTNNLQPDANQRLQIPLILSELEQATKALTKGKSLGPYGVALEFYLKLWPSIGPEFLSMIEHSLLVGRLPQGVNKGLIALIHEGGSTNELSNYCLITLLNVSYKILAKAL